MMQTHPSEYTFGVKPSEQGFTLVEMLISLFIFAIISVGTFSAMNGSLQGKAQMDEKITQMQNIEAMRALIKSDMDNLILRPSRDILGNDDTYVLSGGLGSLIDFTRAGRVNPGGLEARGDMQRVKYVFEQGELIRRYLGHVNPAPNTPEFDRVVLSGLNDVRMQFVSGSGLASRVFVNAGEPSPYKAVYLEIEYANGERLNQYFELGL